MYKHILVPIDGSETSARALDVALQIAREHGAELRALYVVDVPPLMHARPVFDPSIVHDVFVLEGSRVIGDAADKMTRECVKGSPIVLEVDPVGDDIPNQITRAAKAFDAALVVMGTHGRRGWRRLAFGSVAERFMRISTRPVLLVPLRPAGQKPPHTVSAPDVAGAWL